MEISLPFRSSVQTCRGPTDPPQTEQLQREQEKQHVLAVLGQNQNNNKKIPQNNFLKKHSVSVLISFGVGLPVRLILDSSELSQFNSINSLPTFLPKLNLWHLLILGFIRLSFLGQYYKNTTHIYTELDTRQHCCPIMLHHAAREWQPVNHKNKAHRLIPHKQTLAWFCVLSVILR